jgi:hypothetical protein
MSFDHYVQTIDSPASWTEIWHLWTVIVPRRSINGRFVYGKVWRRHDGRDWIYRKFTEYDSDAA